MWQESDTRILFRCKVAERDKAVIVNAAVELYEEVPVKPVAVQATTDAVEEPAGPTAADVFAAIGAHVAAHPDLTSIGKVYGFELSDPDSAWTLDLVNGTMSAGVPAKADCTLALSDANFVSMSTGEVDSMKLYMGGQLKITGDVMASQKLDFLSKVEPAERGEAPAIVEAVAAPKEARQPAAPDLFAKVAAALAASEGPVLQFRVTDPDGAWIVDLTAGTVSEGSTDDAAATFTLSDADLAGLVARTAVARVLFQQGRLRVDGDIRLVHNLDFFGN
jgi:3-hydroxyacyl-CoA dehydrogenase/3a,7a,12a-trihydroxy-5b-cholest-24-enoyl-CoA hydratase